MITALLAILTFSLMFNPYVASDQQNVFCKSRKNEIKWRDYSFTQKCSITSSCNFSSKTLLSSYNADNAAVFWIGESVLQHAYLSFLNINSGYRVKRHVLKNRGEYCTVHGTSLKTHTDVLNFFMIRSQGIYDRPVNDTLRWMTLSKQGVSYKEQFIAHDKYELNGCFKGANLEKKLRKIFELRKISERVVYIQLGLWDVCFSANDLDGFEVKLRSLLKYLNAEAKVLVGYMTAMHNSLPQHEKRYNNSVVGRVRPYNQIIKKVCHELDLPVLTATYTFTKNHAAACIDGVHYAEHISIILASIIRKFICKNLAN